MEAEMSTGKKAGIIYSINLSKKKAELKTPVDRAELVAGMGIKNDGHFGFKQRQVSILEQEAIEKAKKELAKRDMELAEKISAGSFAENITTKGIDLSLAEPGKILILAGKIRLKVSQLGKEDDPNSIVNQSFGISLLPRVGVFCEVLDSGIIKPGDKIEWE